MPSGTAKGHLDDAGSHSRENKKGCKMVAENPRHSFEQLQTCSAEKDGNPLDTRYFIIKSYNHENLQLSISRGIWATQVMNESILEEAFHTCSRVILIFSVNMSGFFQGYAEMMSSIGHQRDNVWAGGAGGINPWGRSFEVKWLRLHDLPFHQTLHLKNPWNEYKPVKQSRDCQELPRDVGEALCELLDGNIDMDASLIRDETSMGDFSSRGSQLDACKALLAENIVPPVPMAPQLYPSSHYHHQTDPIAFCQKRGSLGSSRGSSDTSMPFVLTDEDLLNMTYEEYVEAHTRHINKVYNSGALPFDDARKSSVTRAASNHRRWQK